MRHSLRSSLPVTSTRTTTSTTTTTTTSTGLSSELCLIDRSSLFHIDNKKRKAGGEDDQRAPATVSIPTILLTLLFLPPLPFPAPSPTCSPPPCIETDGIFTELQNTQQDFGHRFAREQTPTTTQSSKKE